MFPLKRIPVTTPSENTAARIAPPPTLPPSLVQPSKSASPVQPLKAPSDFDAKPRWNPKLLLPAGEDKDETVASTMAPNWVTV